MKRRNFLGWLGLGTGIGGAGASDASEPRKLPEGAPGNLGARMARALEMKRIAIASGDQPYGAVVILGDRLLGEAPSRVVVNRDPDAHAEREAIADAQRRLGRAQLDGAWLVSSSRPCGLCERAAQAAGVVRMIHGENLQDAGAPRR